MSAPRGRRTVQAVPVRRYRLALVEEPSGRVVARLPEVPEAIVQRVAHELARLMPSLLVALRVKDTVGEIARAIRTGREGKS